MRFLFRNVRQWRFNIKFPMGTGVRTPDRSRLDRWETYDYRSSDCSTDVVIRNSWNISCRAFSKVISPTIHVHAH